MIRDQQWLDVNGTVGIKLAQLHGTVARGIQVYIGSLPSLVHRSHVAA